jgi:hypothetical protein
MLPPFFVQAGDTSHGETAGGPIVFCIGDREIPFATGNFLTSFSLPNFHFHATTTYAVLRMHGVPLGKRDFLGELRIGARGPRLVMLTTPSETITRNDRVTRSLGARTQFRPGSQATEFTAFFLFCAGLARTSQHCS